MNALTALVGGALLIVGAWLLLAATLAGVGLLFRRVWRQAAPVDLDEGITLIWIGYAVTLLVLGLTATEIEPLAECEGVLLSKATEDDPVEVGELRLR